jgi:hypothetical protein
MRSTPFLVALLSLAACDQSRKEPAPVETKQTYSLCPRSAESRSKLLETMQIFASENRARVSDRGSEAQQELSGMQNKGALISTGGDLVLFTVDKPNAFRVSVSNLGLKEKFSLGVLSRKVDHQDFRITNLMSAIEIYWTVQRSDGGVGNDPPCQPIK